MAGAPALVSSRWSHCLRPGGALPLRCLLAHLLAYLRAYLAGNAQGILVPTYVQRVPASPPLPQHAHPCLMCQHSADTSACCQYSEPVLAVRPG